MSFVNEFVSNADVKKYDLDEVNYKFWKADSRFDWTINRERDIYLRWMKSGRGESGLQQEFSLYWDGTLLAVRMSSSCVLRQDGTKALIWKLHHLVLPGAMKARRDEIIEDLKEALTVYKTDGVRSTHDEHSVIFEF